MSGWFDRDAVPAGWFDENASPEGWFDAPQSSEDSAEATITPACALLTLEGRLAAGPGVAIIRPEIGALSLAGRVPEALDAGEPVVFTLEPAVCVLSLAGQPPAMHDTAPHGRVRRSHRTKYWWDEPKKLPEPVPEPLPIAASVPYTPEPLPPMAALSEAPTATQLNARMEALERRRKRQRRRDDENLIALLVA